MALLPLSSRYPLNINVSCFVYQVALEKQTKEIDAKRRDVVADLAQVEPAVIEAQNGLKLHSFLRLHSDGYFKDNHERER